MAKSVFALSRPYKLGLKMEILEMQYLLQALHHISPVQFPHNSAGLVVICPFN
jgi:hypothetical protein